MFTFDLRRAVLIGVSYMIPFVVVGGLLQALGLLLGGHDLPHDPAATLTGMPASPTSTAGVLHTLGTVAFSLLAPVLAGAIAYALAGRPGIMPGVTAGLAATVIGAGFLGGLVGGILAGVTAHRLTRLPRPDWLRETASFLLVPLAATLISGGAMLALIGPAIAAATARLDTWLTGLNGASTILLGALLGLMIAADLGGPLNKVAYTFAAAGLTTASPSLTTASSLATAPSLVATPADPAITVADPGGGAPMAIMAAVMAAGMAAPLACWLATVVRPSAFTAAERRDGKAAGVLGALFITEGAIPFASVRPLAVLPSLMLGGAVAGAGTMALHATLTAPHGGVLALFGAGHPLGFLASLTLGTAVSAGGLLLTRPRTQPSRKTQPTQPAAAPLDSHRPSEPTALSR
ncbi:PTS fructose transporter subunit IIC [Actinoplanes sp. NPDC049596]|uniref:PTS fructose transporter subunit IIC n=1 Tax=unclassified Actinoplanes TaxID=2626549 RepID=UPI003418BDD4